jgi:type I restriction enzyme S subunit
LFYCLSSRFVYDQAVAVATGTAQKTVPLGGLRLFKIPLIPIEEQNKILSELESRLSVTDQLDQTLTIALQQAETLRQSILKKAFSGQLVPQDPNDEPASELLKRIQAEKAAVLATVKPKAIKKARV